MTPLAHDAARADDEVIGIATAVFGNRGLIRAPRASSRTAGCRKVAIVRTPRDDLRGPLRGLTGRPAGENAGAMRANKRLRPGDGLERNILTEGARSSNVLRSCFKGSI